MEVAPIASSSAAQAMQQQGQQALESTQQGQPAETAQAGSAAQSSASPAGDAHRFEVILSAVNEVENRQNVGPQVNFDQVFEKLRQADKTVSDMKQDFLSNLSSNGFMEPLQQADKTARQLRADVANTIVDTKIDRSIMKMQAEGAIAREYMSASTMANGRLAQSNAALMLTMAGMGFMKEIVNSGVKGINRLISAK